MIIEVVWAQPLTEELICLLTCTKPSSWEIKTDSDSIFEKCSVTWVRRPLTLILLCSCSVRAAPQWGSVTSQWAGCSWAVCSLTVSSRKWTADRHRWQQRKHPAVSVSETMEEYNSGDEVKSIRSKFNSATREPRC